jgi:hypothetical protein
MFPVEGERNLVSAQTLTTSTSTESDFLCFFMIVERISMKKVQTQRTNDSNSRISLVWLQFMEAVNRERVFLLSISSLFDKNE